MTFADDRPMPHDAEAERQVLTGANLATVASHSRAPEPAAPPPTSANVTTSAADGG